MKNYAANNIRNFALVGHGSSGKTMLSESMLYKSGEINRLGSIEEVLQSLIITTMNIIARFLYIHLHYI